MLDRTKEFAKSVALAIGLGNTIIMLWTFYEIYMDDEHWVFVGEPNMWILIPEIALTIFGVIFLSLIFFKDHCANVERIQI